MDEVIIGEVISNSGIRSNYVHDLENMYNRKDITIQQLYQTLLDEKVTIKASLSGYYEKKFDFRAMKKLELKYVNRQLKQLGQQMKISKS